MNNHERYFLECNGALDEWAMMVLTNVFDAMMEQGHVMYIEVNHEEWPAVYLIEENETVPIMIYHEGHPSFEDGSPFCVTIPLPLELLERGSDEVYTIVSDLFNNAVDEMVNA